MFLDMIRQFSENELATSVVTAIVAITYVLAFQRLLKRQRDRQYEKKSELFEILTGGLEQDSLESFDDVVNLYKGIFRIPADDLSYRSRLSLFLREYLAQLVAGKTSATDPELISARKALITSWLQENERLAPFADVPEVERHLIDDISGFADANDIESVKRKLEQLASSITVREHDYQRLSELNRWSVPLAGIGALLTVVFGIASMIG